MTASCAGRFSTICFWTRSRASAAMISWRWGVMSAEHMLEHLQWAFACSTGSLYVPAPRHRTCWNGRSRSPAGPPAHTTCVQDPLLEEVPHCSASLISIEHEEPCNPGCGSLRHFKEEPDLVHAHSGSPARSMRKSGPGTLQARIFHFTRRRALVMACVAPGLHPGTGHDHPLPAHRFNAPGRGWSWPVPVRSRGGETPSQGLADKSELQ